MAEHTKKLHSVSRWYDWFTFFACLVVISVRCLFTESPGTPTADASSRLTNDGISLLISTSLILVFCAWIVFSVLSGRMSYRISWIEPGFILFLIAGAIGIYAASDKRAAVTNVVMMSSAIITGIMLVQVVNNASKARILLIVIIALGVVNLYESYQQFTDTNQMLIDQFEENPESQLNSLGISPGSLNEYLYKHRLYSRDVRGYFKTSNSVGSFILLAIAAGGVILAGRFIPDDKDTRGKVYLIRISVFLALIAVLFLIMSKGAFAAFFAGLILLTFYVLFNKWILKYRYLCLLLVILSVISAYIFIGWYGSARGTLPGGNSMLVRWQYWSSSWQMIKDYWLTGTGPDNFGIYYTYYKIPAALETVRDPHNIFLAVLTQYGIAGLAGLLFMLILPVMKNISGTEGCEKLINRQDQASSKTWVLIFSLLMAVVLIIRYFCLVTGDYQTQAEMFFVFIYMHLVPVMVFAAGCFGLFLTEKYFVSESYFSRHSGAVLLCGIMSVVIANQIDFAIFEPGVWTAFWAVLACWISMNANKSNRTTVNIDCKYIRLALAGSVSILFFVYLGFAVLPPVKAGILHQQALRNMGEIHQVLDKAAVADKLDDKALIRNSAAYVQHYLQTGGRGLLASSEKCLQEASSRNPASFKSHEKLGDLYMLLAKEDPGASDQWFEKAFRSYTDAIARYAGSDRMFYKRAQAAEQLNDIQQAVSDYSRAVEIEDQYRLMFKKMYPEREKVFSRLGQDKYQDAVEKIKKLRQ